MNSWPFGRPRPFPGLPQLCSTSPLRYLHGSQPQSSPWCPTPEAWASAPSPTCCVGRANGLSAGKCYSALIFLSNSSCFVFYTLVTVLRSDVLRLILVPTGTGISECMETFLPLWDTGPVPFALYLYFLIAFSYWLMLNGSEVKASVCNEGDLGSIPGSGRSPGEGNGNPLQYSCLENHMDGGAWWATVHGVAKSRTWLSDFTYVEFNLLF